jgi:hypothetical protein
MGFGLAAHRLERPPGELRRWRDGMDVVDDRLDPREVDLVVARRQPCDHGAPQLGAVELGREPCARDRVGQRAAR